MIHGESGQLNIGPYLIKKYGTVRTINSKKMPGHLTGTVRHLTDPKKKIYIATMEEGLYSLDVNALEVTEHVKSVGNGVKSKLPGYHGKGLYSAQGTLVYSTIMVSIAGMLVQERISLPGLWRNLWEQFRQ